MIKLVSFDIGGTLIKNEQTKYDLKNLTNLLELDYTLVKNAYKNVFQKNKGSFEELVNKFCDMLHIKSTEEINNYFKNKFEENSNSKISQKDIKIIQKLKKDGYKVIFLSNSCCLFKSNIDKNVIDLIDGVFYSYDLGYTKSDSEIYRYIENKFECLPNEMIHIGDTLTSDYKEPMNNGWNALYFGKTNQENIQTINDLTEIFNFIK